MGNATSLRSVKQNKSMVQSMFLVKNPKIFTTPCDGRNIRKQSKGNLVCSCFAASLKFCYLRSIFVAMVECKRARKTKRLHRSHEYLVLPRVTHELFVFFHGLVLGIINK